MTHNAEIDARPACDCAPDCAERIACEKVGAVGHFACGWCDEHQQANHICLCLSRVIPPAEKVVPHEHDQAPDDPRNGDRLTCERCGYSAEFVVLDDGLPGEWVDTTRDIPPATTGDAS